MGKHLDPRPARELTSREVAKLLGGLLGGLADAEWIPIETLKSALAFWVENVESLYGSGRGGNRSPDSPTRFNRRLKRAFR